MSAQTANWVKELCTTVGTGSLTLGGAAVGFAGFQQAFGTSSVQLYYTVRDLTTQHQESGIGTYDGATTITRDTPRDVFVNGVYQQSAPDPVYLSGNSEVSCTFTRGAHADLLQVATAQTTYVPKTTALNEVTGTTSLSLRGNLIAAYTGAAADYDNVSDPNSIVTVSTLNRVARPLTTTEVNYTLELGDANGTVIAGTAIGSGGTVIIYVPNNASTAFTTGDSVLIGSWLDGTVTVSPVSEVTVQKRAGKSYTVSKGGIATLMYVVDNAWILGGDLDDE